MLEIGKRPWLEYVLAVLIPTVALAIRMGLEPVLQGGYPFVTFFPAVALAAYLIEERPALVTVAVSTFLSWAFLITRDTTYAYNLSQYAALALFLFFALAIVRVLGGLRRANQALAREREANLELLAHREVLFRELQHRVGNNIQMIASLIALQQRRMEDPAARSALEEASRRLGLVGRIHRQLYDPAGAQLSLAAYIDQIARDVVAASGREKVEYSFEALSDTMLPAEKAIPTALIVAEALNNALEHGFLADTTGRIAITLEPSETGIVVRIADDGAGLPAEFDLEAAESLGLKIARTLAQSLGGRFSMTAAPIGRGTLACLEIELARPEPPAVPAS